MMDWKDDAGFAAELDKADPLSSFRKKFIIPSRNGKEVVYLCGNSLGLQPRTVSAAIETELKSWAELAVDGHFHGTHPWFYYSHLFKEPIARLTGAQPEETMVMNSLTANLNLMLVSFYRPEKKKFKVMMETPTFPSDHYAVESHIRFHGFNPDEGIIHLTPEKGEETMRPEKVIDEIKKNKGSLALVMMSGVNYYTGQLFGMEAITRAAHDAGAVAGFDLAHAIGNVPLKLHDWNVDFAVWCSYKYLNSGPGGPGGIFVHERHGSNPEIPRLAGWWGYEEATRFGMKPGFTPAKGAAGWAQSNDPVLGMAAHKAALGIFDEAGIGALREKSQKLTGYLEYLIRNINQKAGKELFRTITPSDPEQRGCQLSIIAARNGKAIHEKLTSAGVVSDWREPGVIRVAPVPLYNSFSDVYRFATILGESV